MSIKEFAQTAQGKVALATAGAAPVVAMLPGVALAEGETTTSTVTQGVTNMATTIANDGIAMINGILPVIAPLVGAIAIAFLGVRLVRRFAK